MEVEVEAWEAAKMAVAVVVAVADCDEIQEHISSLFEQCSLSVYPASQLMAQGGKRGVEVVCAICVERLER